MTDMDRPATGPTPQIVGRCEVRREIGRGGTAIVYTASNRNFDRQVVLKDLSRFPAGPVENAHAPCASRVVAEPSEHVIVLEYLAHAGLHTS
jgi:hypothetical protein